MSGGQRGISTAASHIILVSDAKVVGHAISIGHLVIGTRSALSRQRATESIAPNTAPPKEDLYLATVMDVVHPAFSNALDAWEQINKRLEENVPVGPSQRSRIEAFCDTIEESGLEILELQAPTIFRLHQIEIETAADLFVTLAGTLRAGIADNDQNQFENASFVAAHANQHISRSLGMITDFSEVSTTALRRITKGESESRSLTAVAEAISRSNREPCKFCELQKAETALAHLESAKPYTSQAAQLLDVFEGFSQDDIGADFDPDEPLDPSLIERIVAQIDQREKASHQILSLEAPRVLQSAHRELAAVANINLRVVEMQRNLLEGDSNEGPDEEAIVQEANDLAAQQTEHLVRFGQLIGEFNNRATQDEIDARPPDDEYVCKCGYQGPSRDEIRRSVIGHVPSASQGYGCVCGTALILGLVILGAFLGSIDPSLGWLGAIGGGAIGALIIYGLRRVKQCPACETGALERVNSDQGKKLLKRNRSDYGVA